MMESAMLRTEDGVTFRDLNKNGRLDPYEDPRRPIDERVEDLLGQMTLEEKAGMLFHAMLPINPDGTLVEGQSRSGPVSTAEMVSGRLINHFNLSGSAPPRQIAAWYNRLQQLAESTRLGIPVTISSDPRHAFSDNPATSFMAGPFSQWPEPLGLAATRDAALADLATEPRWARTNSTFGEDA